MKSVRVDFLRPACALATAAGSSRQSLDVGVRDGAACPSRPFTPLGTWTMSLP